MSIQPREAVTFAVVRLLAAFVAVLIVGVVLWIVVGTGRQGAPDCGCGPTYH